MFLGRNQLRESLERNFGKEACLYDPRYDYGRMDNIVSYHNEMDRIGKGGDIDDITWNDLEMDDVFWSINRTESYIGEQVLYHRLHDAVNVSELENLESLITYMNDHKELRIDLQEGLHKIGKRKDDYRLPAFLMHSQIWKIGNSTVIHLLQALMVIFVVTAVMTKIPLFVAGAGLICAVNFSIYMNAKLQYGSLLNALGSFRQVILFGELLTGYKDELQTPEEVIAISKDLKGISKRIGKWNDIKNNSIAGDSAALLLDLIMGITLIDLSMFNYIIKGITGKQKQIMKLYDYIGEIDMAISVASYRKSLPYFAIPEIKEGKSMVAVSVVHPLIENAVPNDMTLDKRALISGANASGKSTFMKALAINAILAQTIHTCTAIEFKMPPLEVITSMALRDDLTSGESYYIREAKRIGQMLEKSSDERAAFIVIDEILKGTNTIERIAASIGILNYFAKTNHYVVVATHDMELIDELSGKYDNYYFESTVTDEDIVFEYKIKQGIGGKSNAIALLSLLRYPEEIVSLAKKKVAKTM